MKKRKLLVMIALFGTFVGLLGLSKNVSATEETSIPILRVYNPHFGEHLFTTNAIEKHILVQLGWKDEGTAFYGSGYTTKKVYYAHRVYNPNAGDHHYTTDPNEFIDLLNIGWHDDNIGFYVAGDDGVPVYRVYNPNAKAGAHHFTLDIKEKNHLVQLGWKDEGVGFKAYSTSN